MLGFVLVNVLVHVRCNTHATVLVSGVPLGRTDSAARRPFLLSLGDIRVHVLSDGTFALDGGAMFRVVSRVLWEKTDPPDESNRVTLGPKSAGGVLLELKEA